MSNRDEAQSLQQAFSLHRSGNFAEAAKLYREIIKRNPSQPHALHSLGIIETAAGNHAEAARLMARSLQAQPNNIPFVQNYATVLCQLGQFETAATVALKGLEADRGNAYLLYLLAGAQLKQNRLQDALARFDELLSHEPNHVPGITERVSVLLALQHYDAALAGIEKAIALDPHYAEAHLNRGVACGQLKRYDEAIPAFDRALKLNPNMASAWLGQGNVLFQLKRWDDALAAYDRAHGLSPDFDEAWRGRGNALSELQRFSEAAVAYDHALGLNPRSAEAWVGRGNVACELKQYDEALAAYDKAFSFNERLAEAWLGRGNVLLAQLRHEAALGAYETALGLKPGLAEAALGRGNSLFGLKRHDEALAAYDAAAELAEAWVGRGNVFYGRKRHPEAAAAYDQAISLKPALAQAWYGRGNLLREIRQYDAALAAYDRALNLKPDLIDAVSTRLNVKNCICHWAGWDADAARLIAAVRSGNVNAAPFEFLAIPSSAEDQLQCARQWIRIMHPGSGQPLWQGERYIHDRIRVAYLSSDFREHPVAYLTAGLFEHHDKSRFELTAISWARDDGSEVRRRIEASFDRFIDVEALGDDEVARLIRSLEIDILVDLTGLTKYARPDIAARRPAPVQVNYLGYPGTMGADYIDYIIADKTLIPAAHQRHYREKIAWLPHSYMPHDDAGRAISDRALTRVEFGLPETGFVFCCFNNAYKLTPHFFAARMKLLKAVPGSVLWLTRDNASAVDNLRKEAIAAGVDPDRLVFADRLPSMADHLARHRLADLFLDTLPYNAHTTTSDALWAGLPVLTQMGDTFAGRVAASLLMALGLPELIAETPEQFESMAIELATEPAKLAAIRARLAEHRATQPLFDTQLYTRHLERAYLAMHQRQESGLPPEHIHIAG